MVCMYMVTIPTRAYLELLYVYMYIYIEREINRQIDRWMDR